MTESQHLVSSPHEPSANGRDQLASFLALCSEQLRSAIAEANVGSEQLVDATLAVSHAAAQLQQTILSEDVQASNVSPSVVVDSATQVGAKLQWLDRFSQRLGHVEEQIRQLTAFLAEGAESSIPCEWSGFLDGVRAGYTTDEERQIFDRAYGLSDSQSTNDSDDDHSQETILF